MPLQYAGYKVRGRTPCIKSRLAADLCCNCQPTGSGSAAQVLKKRSEGMPHRDDPASFGDMHVKAGGQFNDFALYY